METAKISHQEKEEKKEIKSKIKSNLGVLVSETLRPTNVSTPYSTAHHQKATGFALQCRARPSRGMIPCGAAEWCQMQPRVLERTRGWDGSDGRDATWCLWSVIFFTYVVPLASSVGVVLLWWIRRFIYTERICGTRASRGDILFRTFCGFVGTLAKQGFGSPKWGNFEKEKGKGEIPWVRVNDE